FAFSPNSKLLAASCSDTTILVWPASAADARAGKPLDENDLAQVLETGGGPEAYEAIGRLIADPERALPFLERRLRPGPRGEASHVKQTALSAEDLLHVRAIQALERMGTKRAWQLLHTLAQGAEKSPRTRAAVEALERRKAQ